MERRMLGAVCPDAAAGCLHDIGVVVTTRPQLVQRMLHEQGFDFGKGLGR